MAIIDSQVSERGLCQYRRASLMCMGEQHISSEACVAGEGYVLLQWVGAPTSK